MKTSQKKMQWLFAVVQEI